jgi:hypothetical protein
MALNEWWREDATERYWMEITDRDDLGADLHAPQLDDASRENWTYALVTAVRPGDVVLHWHKRLRGYPGIVGHSVAAGAPIEDQIVWTAHGSYGRVRPSTTPEPSWRLPLTDYTSLPEPVGQDAFRAIEPRLRKIKSDLEKRHGRLSLYYPFAFSDTRPVRAAQGYLVKFPAAIVGAVRALASIRAPVPDTPSPNRSDAATAASEARALGGSGYLADKVLQLAIERHAVRWAMDFYSNRGYEVKDVGSERSYDVHATRGAEGLHVEVKGSTGLAATVELTRKEVVHSREALTDLVVVDQIGWSRQPDGSIQTFGGRARRWASWSAADSLLQPTRYRYELRRHATEYRIDQ